MIHIKIALLTIRCVIPNHRVSAQMEILLRGITINANPRALTFCGVAGDCAAAECKISNGTAIKIYAAIAGIRRG